MLTSLHEGHGHHDQEEEEQRQHQHQQQPVLLPPRQLLLSCAELADLGDVAAARRAVSLLTAASSPFGDAADRLAHQLSAALSLHLDRLSGHHLPAAAASAPAADLQSAYLSLNQVTPFLRFAHLTANQAILESAPPRRPLHIIDLDVSHGLQWPPLLQSLAALPFPPSSVRLTAAGSDPSVLRRTGDRLASFAASLNLPFHFHPLLGPSPLSSVQLHAGETLAVNLVLFLNRLITGDHHLAELRQFLSTVKSMAPAVVTLAEREAAVSGLASRSSFRERLAAALDYYLAVFESLEATLPPQSRERMAVERVWLGREIAGAVCGEGAGGWEGRSERSERWEALMRAAGFASRPMSPFAVSQARLLLRLHYPSEGYQLQMVRDSFFLGWQTRPLFSVSSWD